MVSKRAIKKTAIELAGLPSSGKTTLSKALKSELRKQGIKCRLFPSLSKTSHLQARELGWKFDLVATATVVADLVKFEHDNLNTVAIFDRGLFDTLCWIEWQSKGDYGAKDSLDACAKLLTSKGIFSGEYHAYCLTIGYVEAAVRGKDDNGIVNSRNFDQFRNIYESAASKYADIGVIKRLSVIDAAMEPKDQMVHTLLSDIRGLI